MRIAIYGAGQVGTSVAHLLSRRPGHIVEGPYHRRQRDTAMGSGADVVVIATTSFMSEVAPDIRAAVMAGSNVITTAEEAAFPWYFDSDLAEGLDRLARSKEVTIVGAGLNPGFAFDALVLTASGVTSEIKSVRVERVVDLSGFSKGVLRRLGIGFYLSSFDEGVAAGTITGHIGFPQSMRIVAHKIGVALSTVERQIRPIEAAEGYRAGELVVLPGQTAGFNQHYVGMVDGRPWFEALFLGHLNLEAVGRAPRDEILIESSAPPLHVVIEPGINPQAGAPRLIANSIERLVDAPPGWLTVGDLPPATPGGVHNL